MTGIATARTDAGGRDEPALKTGMEEGEGDAEGAGAGRGMRGAEGLTMGTAGE